MLTTSSFQRPAAGKRPGRSSGLAAGQPGTAQACVTSAAARPPANQLQAKNDRCFGASILDMHSPRPDASATSAARSAGELASASRVTCACTHGWHGRTDVCENGTETRCPKVSKGKALGDVRDSQRHAQGSASCARQPHLLDHRSTRVQGDAQAAQELPHLLAALHPAARLAGGINESADCTVRSVSPAHAPPDLTRTCAAGSCEASKAQVVHLKRWETRTQGAHSSTLLCMHCRTCR